MNQIFYYANRIEIRSSARAEIAKLGIFLVLSFVLTVCTSEHAKAQGSFVPQNDSQSSYAQWSPPSSHAPIKDHASDNSLPAASNELSFPKSPIAFDPGVRAANFETPVPQTPEGEKSFDATIDSTATMISNLKDATSQKLSGLAENFNQNGTWPEKINSLLGSSETSRMLGSLTFVLGIYFVFVWVMRKINPSGNAGLPPEVIEVIGQVPFGPKKNLQLVRLGSKLLLLMNSPDGTQPIGEITDPTEVDYLTSLCPGKRQTGRGNIAAIQRVADRMVNAKSAPTSEPTPPAPTPAPTTNSNLANILRTLDQASKQNPAVFEA